MHSCSGPRFNIKMPSYQYRKSHCGDKMAVRSSYLHNGISYTGKISSLYWIGAQMLLVSWIWNRNTFYSLKFFNLRNWVTWFWHIGPLSDHWNMRSKKNLDNIFKVKIKNWCQFCLQQYVKRFWQNLSLAKKIPLWTIHETFCNFDTYVFVWVIIAEFRTISGYLRR